MGIFDQVGQNGVEEGGGLNTDFSANHDSVPVIFDTLEDFGIVDKSSEYKLPIMPAELETYVQDQVEVKTI